MSRPTMHENPQSLMLQNWRLISDRVMGGQSSGQMQVIETSQGPCLHLSGNVSTANNGGFIQIAHDLSEQERRQASIAHGIKLTVRGNNETYNIHLRTSQLSLPWQSYRASFFASEDLSEVKIPFTHFEPYRIVHKLDLNRLKRVGIVAIGRNFDADICVADVSFY